MSNPTAGLFPEAQEGKETTPQGKKRPTKRAIQNYVHADKQRVNKGFEAQWNGKPG